MEVLVVKWPVARAIHCEVCEVRPSARPKKILVHLDILLLIESAIDFKYDIKLIFLSIFVEQKITMLSNLNKNLLLVIKIT